MESSYYANQNYNNNTTLNTYLVRGGCLQHASVDYAPIIRGYHWATSTDARGGFRTVLYIK